MIFIGLVVVGLIILIAVVDGINAAWDAYLEQED